MDTGGGVGPEALDVVGAVIVCVEGDTKNVVARDIVIVVVTAAVVAAVVVVVVVIVVAAAVVVDAVAIAVVSVPMSCRLRVRYSVVAAHRSVEYVFKPA